MTDSSEPLLHGQTAFVTGATGGIGMATSRLLASLGCSVALHYNSDQETAIALKDEMTSKYGKNFGSKFVALAADMSDYDAVSLIPRSYALSCPT
jgi:3-oxoacyl-[acyl-carrier protein] reductase